MSARYTTKGDDAMMNNNDFIGLERRLWAEGNPLCDELVSTRDSLLALLDDAKYLLQKYQPILDSLGKADDLDFYREWDDFGSTVDMINDELGNE